MSLAIETLETLSADPVVCNDPTGSVSVCVDGSSISGIVCVSGKVVSNSGVVVVDNDFVVDEVVCVVVVATINDQNLSMAMIICLHILSNIQIAQSLKIQALMLYNICANNI